MKGKIDETGWFYKENPNGNMVACDCCADASEVCHWSCAAFEGPLPDHKCDVDGECPPKHKDAKCHKCPHWIPITAIKICQNRRLFFDEFEDERVPK